MGASRLSVPVVCEECGAVWGSTGGCARAVVVVVVIESTVRPEKLVKVTMKDGGAVTLMVRGRIILRQYVLGCIPLGFGENQRIAPHNLLHWDGGSVA